MSIVLLVRHAQASFGLGTYDRLSDHGRAQAARLGQVLQQRAIQVDRIVSGGLDRQRETAEILSKALDGPPLSIDPRWDEYDYVPLIASVKPAYRRQWVMAADLARARNPGQRLQEILDEALAAWVARDTEQAVRRPPVDADDTRDLPDGDQRPVTFTDYADRIGGALNDATAEPGTTVVVSSAGTIAAAAAPLLGVPPAAWPALHRVMVNSGVTKVVRGQRGLSLVSFNEHGHLEGAPDVKITYR